MLNRLRWRLTLIYACTALLLLAAVGGSVYWMTVRYFRFATERALLERMTLELEQLAAPLPPALQAYRPQQLPDERPVDNGTLASTFVFTIDQNGQVFNPNPWNPPIQPDQAAIEAAKAGKLDLRTINLADGTQVALLTEKLTRSDGPAFLQVGRVLNEQEAALSTLLKGLVALWAGSVVVLGWFGWWLAGRSLRPAQQAWERQQAFIANASHELRAPLTLMRASSEIALRESTDPAEQQELLEDILAETYHMARLVEDLLLLSRLDAAKTHLQRETIDLAELCQDVAKDAGRLAHDAGVEVRVAHAEGQIKVDRTRLRQVLLILLDNAIAHTPRGGSVVIHAERKQTSYQISVIDTGKGIEPKHLKHIFERFYRVDSARIAGGRGNGLGLSIAQALIQAHNGTIEAQSNVGTGTTMLINLPK